MAFIDTATTSTTDCFRPKAVSHRYGVDYDKVSS